MLRLPSKVREHFLQHFQKWSNIGWLPATKKHTTKDNADALRRIPNFDRQDASHPEKPFTGCLDPFNTISTEPITAPKQAVLQFGKIRPQWTSLT